ncbi:putative udp-galactose transporter like protein [Rosellinia necatrix]|uniref:Putative udp-galactose transporter like protein n=1 Tax=Rosellinia necatrix TaxID=77044 RepID=A0A1S7ULY2_ROSNE|nr:putative udp-galactose transporter like protein [Rosellinia necatrix]
MARATDPSQDGDNHLRQLEEQVDKFVIALDEWQQWKQEYEALRKDTQALSPVATRIALAHTRRSFRGKLVDEKELVSIFGRNDSKKRDQIISTVSNRLDYVSKNIATLTTQLEAAEDKLASARAVGDPEALGEDGLAITEISEELDDDDNVISYSLRRPGDNQPQLLEALEKAGVEELLPPGSGEPAPNPKSDTLKPKPVADSRKQSHLKTKGEDTSETVQAPKKKSVTFAEDTKEASDGKPKSNVQKLQDLYRQAKDQESIITEPIMPADESPEDAELREDMIRYNKQTMMYEMAPIVAELQLEEGSAEDDDWNDYDSDFDEDDEDEWGRSTSGVVDDEYRRQMLELKERLSKKTFGEQRKIDDEEADEFAEGIGRITVKPENISPGQDGSDLPAVHGDIVPKDEPKKSVRFAPSLDVAEPTLSSTQPKPLGPQQLIADPLSDVVERRPSGPVNKTSTSGRTLSKFRKERALDGAVSEIAPIAPEKPINLTKYAPSGPEGQTLAPDILEHEPSNEIKEPDELDANLLHQQVTEEYHKMRVKMIGRQGGFLKESTDPIQPLEEEEGGPKRVSRFKAASLAKSQASGL